MEAVVLSYICRLYEKDTCEEDKRQAHAPTLENNVTVFSDVHKNSKSIFVNRFSL